MNQPTGEMNGKVCVVTGATSGIGKVTAQVLAQKGATVIVIARDRHRGEVAVQEINANTGSRSVSLIVADLASQSSIRRLAQEMQQQYAQLDVLINNAGAFNMQRTLTVDGLEATFATNHLGPFLLTNLLIDRLKASGSSRIINVSSIASQSGSVDFDNLQGERSYSGPRAYAQSKLANILFTVALAKRLQGTGVTVNALHPGFVATNLGQNNRLIWRLVFRLVYVFRGISPEQGAEAQIYLATAPEVANITGQYFDRKTLAEPNPIAKNASITERLWEVSAQLVGLAA